MSGQLAVVYAVRVNAGENAPALYFPRSHAAPTPDKPRLWVSRKDAQRKADKPPSWMWTRDKRHEVVAFRLVPVDGEEASQ